MRCVRSRVTYSLDAYWTPRSEWWTNQATGAAPRGRVSVPQSATGRRACGPAPSPPPCVNTHPAPPPDRRTPLCDGDFLNGRPDLHLFLQGVVCVTTGRSLPGSPAPDDTSVRYSSGLASTSRPGCAHRCLRASLFAPLASRLVSVQGPFEKIYFQDLLGIRIKCWGCPWKDLFGRDIGI